MHWFLFFYKNHRRRIYTEEQAKVVHDELKNRILKILLVQNSLALQGIDAILSPQEAATTFAFPSVWFLFYDPCPRYNCLIGVVILSTKKQQRPLPFLLSDSLVPWDILSLGPYVLGRFVLGRFVPWDVLFWDCLFVHHNDTCSYSGTRVW